MSIRHSLLALLGEGDSYGYQLKNEFEARTGGMWPLNIGQVYTTLERLERDGLVERRGSDADGRVGYAITEAGRAEVADWFGSPVRQSAPARDELAIKLALAITLPDVDVGAIVQTQRKVAILVLQDLNRARRAATDVAWRLVLESRIYHTEAEVRWLDHCEAAVLQTPARTRARGVAAPASAGSESNETHRTRKVRA